MPDPLTELRPGQTWLTVDEAGRRVVHKRLPDDCCQREQLHPSVKLRLQKFRELPLSSFVNVIGVERTDRGVVLVSEYVEGKPLDQIPEADRIRMVRELRLAVMSMHQHGMVHGAIKPGNAIVTPDGLLKLIDPSPLLHDDPVADLAAVDAMDPLAEPASDKQSVDAIEQDDHARRQRTVAAAVALATLAVVAAVVTAIYLRG
jgi:hypothetical protein